MHPLLLDTCIALCRKSGRKNFIVSSQKRKDLWSLKMNNKFNKIILLCFLVTITILRSASATAHWSPSTFVSRKSINEASLFVRGGGSTKISEDEDEQLSLSELIEEAKNSNRKIVVVTGGVLSGIGKGVTASSIGVLFRALGLRVTALKIDPYLNVDAGTMSPFEHGEVFVLDDGGETDLDLGNYERFLSVSLTKESNLSTGKIYQVSAQ